MRRVIIIVFLNIFLNVAFGQYSAFYEDTIFNGQIKKIEVLMYNPDSSILNRNIYEYNLDGNLTHIEIGNKYSLLGTTSKSIKIFYDALNRKIQDSTIFTNRQNPLIETRIYSYFDSTSIERDFTNGNLNGELIKQFDKHGKLSNKRYIRTNEQNFLYEVYYEYYEDGNIKFERHRDNYDSKKTKEYCYAFTYYESGLIKSQIKNNIDTTCFFYADNEQIKRVCFADSTGKECYTYQEAFGPEPLPFDSIYFDSDARKIKITEWKLTQEDELLDKFIYEYDERDNWIKKLHFRDDQLFLFEERKIEYQNKKR